ncbi:uncharacterized protein ACLA_069850 [Aspergillus clavatus NRRL 1]|uniref:Transcription initiation factor Rrn11 n=1 Tax=Aspergillus clavatus (strain ATCC 1007 / CBS 513.65 / DSM 816 / NCTC 3887 / NRRL 1 / QM 1276 / 107) TaxID=344612 RepID=A1C6D3_ASPCL|nr:uncharacterized protein ACLA_069850 [Aspergillus clavatus NRRL 1]EAW13954.1 conserved hypothetical protein [Aspergillus clavatus NRRL 1]
MASVPTASAFSLPLPSWQQPPSVRVARYEPRKRKKYSDDWDDDDDDDDGEQDDGETTDAASEMVPTAPSLTLSPDEAHQYRVAGLSFDRELPGGSFPHAPARTGRAKGETHGDILKSLSSLSPPIYPPQSAAHQGNLRLQHLAAITTVLHRCLLHGDYIRAGRAWGLILREEYAGSPIDVRVDGRWGVGAEILLRRGRQISESAATRSEEENDLARTRYLPKPCFTRKGFEDAKHYYERLVVQHPYRKSAPDAVSALHFYPAMFGLWVYVAQEESVIAREEIQSRPEDLPGEFSEDEDTEPGYDGKSGSKQGRIHLLASVRAKELEEAQQIAARMDEILMSPPYSDSPELLELRGMVSLWIGDLLISCLPYEDEEGYDFDDHDSGKAEDLHGSIQARRERRLAMEKRQAEIQKSREFFEKARQRGKGVAHTLEHFHIDDSVSLGSSGMGF